MDCEDTNEHLFSGKCPESVFDLSIGAPGPSILTQLPSRFAESTNDRMREEEKLGTLFQYGPEQGLKSFRQNLAKFLSSEYGDNVDSDQLVLTTGATCGLTLTATILLNRNGVVFVENPTYFIALKMLQGDLGLQCIPVDMNDGGIDCDLLESALKKYRNKELEKDGRFSCMFYTIPTYHNPTGMSYSESTCSRLLSLSKEYNMLVVCDDVYNILRYGDKPSSSRLKSRDPSPDSRVISNGTFSKILSPGLRLGWLEVPTWLVSRYTSSGFLLSGGATNNYTSGIVAQIIKCGKMNWIVDHLKGLYSERMKHVHEYLTKNLPEKWTVEFPGGGYFLWVRADKDLSDFCKKLETEGVMVLHGRRATPETSVTDFASNKFDHCVRISIAYYDQPDLAKACEIFCRVAKDF